MRSHRPQNIRGDNAIGYLPKLDKDPITEYTTYLIYKTWSYQAGAHVEASSILASFHGLDCPTHATEKKDNHQSYLAVNFKN